MTEKFWLIFPTGSNLRKTLRNLSTLRLHNLVPAYHLQYTRTIMKRNEIHFFSTTMMFQFIYNNCQYTCVNLRSRQSRQYVIELDSTRCTPSILLRYNRSTMKRVEVLVVYNNDVSIPLQQLLVYLSKAEFKVVTAICSRAGFDKMRATNFAAEHIQQWPLRMYYNLL